MKTYTANELNQYTANANPDAVGLRGSATNTATVTVNGNAASSDTIASDTVPWHFALMANNADGPDYTFASIMAVVDPPGTNTPDIVESTSGSVYAPPQAEALTYDDDGNLLNDGRFNYTWNSENRLVKAEEQVCPTNRTLRKVEYAYDHQGRMVWKVVSRRGAEAQSWEAEKAIAYLWDDFNIIAETVASDSATNTTYNIWGLDIDGTLQGAGGVGGLLAVVKDFATYVPAWDANGNIMEYVSTDGSIVAHREYDPFGGTVVFTSQSAITSPQSAMSFSHWFSTKPWCNVTGLSEYQYRKYSQAMGRWLSRYPMAERGGININVFVKNRPLVLFDPDGCDVYTPWNARFWKEEFWFDSGWPGNFGDDILGSATFTFRGVCSNSGELTIDSLQKELIGGKPEGFMQNYVAALSETYVSGYILSSATGKAGTVNFSAIATTYERAAEDVSSVFFGADISAAAGLPFTPMNPNAVAGLWFASLLGGFMSETIVGGWNNSVNSGFSVKIDIECICVEGENLWIPKYSLNSKESWHISNDGNYSWKSTGKIGVPGWDSK